MSQSKRIILFTIGNIDHPSSRIRGIQYIPYFEDAGYRVRWVPRVPPKPRNKINQYLFFPILKRWLFLKQLITAIFSEPDLFIFQKVFLPTWVLKVINRKNIKIIYDFDDAIYLTKDLITVDPVLEKKTIAMVKHASLTIVSTSYLSEWCISQGFKSTIITTPVDIYDINRIQKETTIIGWMGSITNTVHLEELKQPLRELARKFNIELLLIGADKSFNINGVKVIHKSWKLEKEPEYLSIMDIGIMPLLKNNYSKGKGGYKIFVYMGASLPVVATPIGINKEIIKEGITGFLANNTEEWVTNLSQLISDKGLRYKMGTKAKEIAVQNFSREVCSKKIILIINNLTAI